MTYRNSTEEMGAGMSESEVLRKPDSPCLRSCLKLSRQIQGRVLVSSMRGRRCLVSTHHMDITEAFNPRSFLLETLILVSLYLTTLTSTSS